MRVLSRQRGVTLIELTITVAVAAVLLLIAVPGFRSITLSNRLNTAANDLVNAISVARMEAVKRNASTQFCSNSASANSTDSLGSTCGTQTGAVQAMQGPSVEPVLAGVAGITAPIQLDGDLVALRFSAQGVARQVGSSTPYGNVVADICTSQLSRNNHRVITMVAGSILTTTLDSRACPSS